MSALYGVLKFMAVLLIGAAVIWGVWIASNNSALGKPPCTGDGRQMPDETTSCDLGNGWRAECLNGAEIWTKYDDQGNPVAAKEGVYAVDNC